MVTPYLVFAGCCKEAAAFYQDVFESQVEGLRCYDEYVPEGLDPVPEGLSAWVMHAEMTIRGTRFWLADDPDAPALGEQGHVRLTVTVETAEDAGRIYRALLRGGHSTLPPTQTFYSALHAAAVDRFGIHWNVVALERPTE